MVNITELKSKVTKLINFVKLVAHRYPFAFTSLLLNVLALMIYLFSSALFFVFILAAQAFLIWHYVHEYRKLNSNTEITVVSDISKDLSKYMMSETLDSQVDRNELN